MLNNEKNNYDKICPRKVKRNMEHAKSMRVSWYLLYSVRDIKLMRGTKINWLPLSAVIMSQISFKGHCTRLYNKILDDIRNLPRMVYFYYVTRTAFYFVEMLPMLTKSLHFRMQNCTCCSVNLQTGTHVSERQGRMHSERLN